MAGRRHHTIPKFLLKAFASSTRGKVTNVWCYRKSAVGIETNIDNVSVEKDFYGKKPETDLDDRITKLENTFAPFVADLRAGKFGTGPLQDRRIAELVAHLATRTRSLRHSATSTIMSFADAMRRHVMRPEYLRVELRKSFGKREVSQLIRAEMKKQGARAFDIERQLPVLVPRLMPEMEHLIDRLIEEEAPLYDIAFEDGIKGLPDSLRAVFIERLADNLELSGRTDVYATYSWFVLPVDQPIILGDTICLFKTIGTRAYKPLDYEDDHTIHILLPIAKDRLLVGALDGQTPDVNVAELNAAAAACSFDFFVSSRQLTESEPILINMVGINAGLLNDHERQKIIREATHD